MADTTNPTFQPSENAFREQAIRDPNAGAGASGLARMWGEEATTNMDCGSKTMLTNELNDSPIAFTEMRSHLLDTYATNTFGNHHVPPKV